MRKLTEKQVVLATHNVGKVKEMQAILAPFGIKVLSADDLNLSEPDENGTTFFVSPSVFQKEICKNFNRKTVISLLIEQGFLLKDHNGDYRTPDGNKKVYVISGSILL